MDANQQDLANPFGMDEDCRNCPALCESRNSIVHGYGDVGAEFLVLFDHPSDGADAAGTPFGGEFERSVVSILETVGLVEPVDDGMPEPSNVFFTYVTRCRHPERPATDEEARNCEPFLNSEIRMINPELLLPVGQRALDALAFEYTTLSEDDLDVADHHATTIRGRGFELLPMIEPTAQTEAERGSLVDHLNDTLDRDYRQTKGRRSR
jgi:uracil-DNA glycosylase family 4